MSKERTEGEKRRKEGRNKKLYRRMKVRREGREADRKNGFM